MATSQTCSLNQTVKNEPECQNLPTRIPLFADVQDRYHPEVHWLDGSVPQHPFFHDSSRIQDIICEIKTRLAENLLIGCVKLVNSLPRPHTADVAVLGRSLQAHPGLWIAVLSAQKYGTIYWVSRSEARSSFWPLVRNHLAEAGRIDRFLRRDGMACRAFNYAVFCLVKGHWLKVEHATKLVPPNAISCIGNGAIAVRKRDFEGSADEVLNDPSPMYDLHDFSHLATATLSPELYGNKYFSHLVNLGPRLTALIRSPGTKTASGPKLSDGMLFSEILTDLYTCEAELHLSRQVAHCYGSLEKKLAQRLAGYLLGGTALHHMSTQTLIRVDEPITPIQLAVLAQNKAYELTASEMEQRLFTRGGGDGDEGDVLGAMTGIERIEYLSTSKSWLYFEVRNTIKHRAHKEAYRLVALHFMANQVQVDLVAKILENLDYEDWREGRRLDLWAVLKGVRGEETSS